MSPDSTTVDLAGRQPGVALVPVPPEIPTEAEERMSQHQTGSKSCEERPCFFRGVPARPDFHMLTFKVGGRGRKPVYERSWFVFALAGDVGRIPTP